VTRPTATISRAWLANRHRRDRDRFAQPPLRLAGRALAVQGAIATPSAYRSARALERAITQLHNTLPEALGVHEARVDASDAGGDARRAAVMAS
jgi:hypothetical protein